MPRRLLVINDPSVAAQEGLDGLLTPEAGFNCEYIRWDSLAAERLPALEAHLIVTLPVADPARAISLFEWLRRHPAPTPTLAVLPGESDQELLRIASEAAADILLPFHCSL